MLVRREFLLFGCERGRHTHHHVRRFGLLSVEKQTREDLDHTAGLFDYQSRTQTPVGLGGSQAIPSQQPTFKAPHGIPSVRQPWTHTPRSTLHWKPNWAQQTLSCWHGAPRPWQESWMHRPFSQRLPRQHVLSTPVPSQVSPKIRHGMQEPFSPLQVRPCCRQHSPPKAPILEHGEPCVRQQKPVPGWQ
jgi:hypothetical protein